MRRFGFTAVFLLISGATIARQDTLSPPTQRLGPMIQKIISEVYEQKISDIS
jgi:hypothetical protein